MQAAGFTFVCVLTLAHGIGGTTAADGRHQRPLRIVLRGALCATLAALIPARRAATIDPQQALRME